MFLSTNWSNLLKKSTKPSVAYARPIKKLIKEFVERHNLQFLFLWIDELFITAINKKTIIKMKVLIEDTGN